MSDNNEALVARIMDGIMPHIFNGDEPIEREDIEGSIREALSAAGSKSVPEHSTECKYQHFLAYSGEQNTGLLRKAYFHGANDDDRLLSEECRACIAAAPSSAGEKQG